MSSWPKKLVLIIAVAGSIVIVFRGFNRIQAIAAAIGIVAIVWVFSDQMDVHPLLPIVGFVSLFALMLGDTFIHFMPPHPDAHNYDAWAWSVTEYIVSIDIPEPPHYALRVNAYSYFVGLLYVFTGRNQLLMATINAGFWGIAVALWMRIADYISTQLELDKELQMGSITGILLILYPASKSYMAANLREPVAILFFSLFCLAFLRWLNTRSYRYLFTAVTYTFPVALVRPEVFAVLLIVAGTTISGVIARDSERQGPMILVLTSIVAVFITYFMSLFDVFSLRWLDLKRAANAIDPKGYLPQVTYESWFDVIQYLPLRIIYLLLTPFPWDAENYAFLITTIDSLFVLAVLPFALAGAVTAAYHWNRNTAVFLIGMSIFQAAGYAIVVSSAGTSTRRRLFVMPVLILFAAYYVSTIVAFEFRLPDDVQ